MTIGNNRKPNYPRHRGHFPKTMDVMVLPNIDLLKNPGSPISVTEDDDALNGLRNAGLFVVLPITVLTTCGLNKTD